MHTCTQALQRQLRLRRQWKSHKWEREAEEGSDGERTQANSGAGSSSSPVERSDVQSFDRAAAFDGGGRGGGENGNGVVGVNGMEVGVQFGMVVKVGLGS